jgi:hypothetical protein
MTCFMQIVIYEITINQEDRHSGLSHLYLLVDSPD